MSELEQATSGADPDTSGSGSQAGQTKSTSGDDGLQRNNEKLLREKKNSQLALQEARLKIEQFESKERQQEETQLLAKNEHEKVIEILKKQLAEKDGQLNETTETIKKGRINSAVVIELEKLGFVNEVENKEAALKLISQKDVTVDPTTNVIVGADEAAKEFHRKWSHLGFFGKKNPSTNSSAPQLDAGGKVDINTLSTEDKYKLLADLAKGS